LRPRLDGLTADDHFGEQVPACSRGRQNASVTDYPELTHLGSPPVRLRMASVRGGGLEH
jgi:hypothetical protein